MARVKRGVQASKRRKNVLKNARGIKWGRKNKFRAAKEALQHAWVHAFQSRRKKKGDFRRLWQIKIGAATRLLDLPYNRFIAGLKKAHIDLDRKILSDLAANHPEIFKKILEKAQNA